MTSSRALFFVGIGLLAGSTTTGVARAQQPGSDTTQGGSQAGSPSGTQGTAGTQQQAQQAPPSVMSGHLITASAKVDNVDIEKREMTLKAQNGKPFTIQVPESVTRLENVKPGDTVRASFYESVAVSLQKPGEAKMGEKEQTTTERAPGQLPSGTTMQQVTTTAKITKLDPGKSELTIETSTGKSNTIKVDDPQVRADMKTLKVGDKIQATYTTAMATSVTAPQHM
jgi:hypothetical protein